MDFEEIFRKADDLIFCSEGRHLSEAERVVLRAAWENITYEKAAADIGYSASYLKRDIGPKLWKRISKVLQEPIGKKNFRLRFDQSPFNRLTETVFPAAHLPDPSVSLLPPAVAQSLQSWGELALDVSNFWGREADLSQIKSWIIDDGCRLVQLWGAASVGKTFLAVRLAKQMQKALMLFFVACCRMN